MSVLSDIIYWTLIVFMTGVLLLLAIALTWTGYVRWHARREDARLRRELEEGQRPWDWLIDGGPRDHDDFPLSNVQMLDQVPRGWVEEYGRR